MLLFYDHTSCVKFEPSLVYIENKFTPLQGFKGFKHSVSFKLTQKPDTLQNQHVGMLHVVLVKLYLYIWISVKEHTAVFINICGLLYDHKTCEFDGGCPTTVGDVSGL